MELDTCAKTFSALILVALGAVLAGCGGGNGGSGAAEDVSVGLPLAADAQPQLPQALTMPWQPSGLRVMDWVESAYPQLFPSGPLDKSDIPPYTYRQYPQTGNYLAVTNDSLYIHGPVASGVLTRVGSFSDLRCRIDPYACSAQASQAPVAIPAPVSASPQPSSILSGVRASLSSPSRILADIVRGQKMNDVTLFGSALGNVSALSGRTVYVIVEDPHGLFEPRASVRLSGIALQLALSGAVQSTVGMRSGNLKIHACLDPQCTSALENSPILLPYQVNVVADVAVTAEAIGVYPGFGEVPASRDLSIILPRDTREWSASIVDSVGNAISVRSDSALTTGEGHLSVSFEPMPVGSYSANLVIRGSRTTLLTPTLFSGFSKTIPITYVVNPNPAVDALIYPAQTTVAMKYGDRSASSYLNRVALGNTGVTLRWDGTVEYLSARGQAPTVDLFGRRGWWWGVFSSRIEVCNGLFCLPPGTYTARLPYIKTKDGVSSTLYHPVTLQIYP